MGREFRVSRRIRVTVHVTALETWQGGPPTYLPPLGAMRSACALDHSGTEMTPVTVPLLGMSELQKRRELPGGIRAGLPAERKEVPR